MRIILTTLFASILCAVGASAQSSILTGRSRTVDVSLGYAYVLHTISPSNRVGLSGADASATIGLNSYLGIKADLGYARASRVLGAPSQSDVFSYLAGPVFTPKAQGNFRPYVHGLLGGAKVSGPVPVSGGILIGGKASGFAWAIGGGADYQVSDSFAIRTGVDYMRTGYFGSSLAIQGQPNIRVTAAVVYMFGMHHWKRR
jgi:opacity protein-like surface antigen